MYIMSYVRMLVLKYVGKWIIVVLHSSANRPTLDV